MKKPNRIQLWYARLRWGDPIDLLEADVSGAKSNLYRNRPGRGSSWAETACCREPQQDGLWSTSR